VARDHGRIRLDIWADEEWRELPSPAQWLYLHLLSSPSLNFCGVTDWRPARIAALAAELTADDVEYAAGFLEREEFVVIDRVTEEALVRSFVKHDGLLRSPNVTKAMVKDHGAIGSAVLRAVIVGQLVKIHEKQPDLAGWKSIGNLLEKRSLTPSEAFAELPENPSGNPFGNPSENRAPLRSPYSLLPSPGSAPSSDSQPSVKSKPGKQASA
jgi:hypothetical protein